MSGRTLRRLCLVVCLVTVLSLAPAFSAEAAFGFGQGDQIGSVQNTPDSFFDQVWNWLRSFFAASESDLGPNLDPNGKPA